MPLRCVTLNYPFKEHALQAWLPSLCITTGGMVPYAYPHAHTITQTHNGSSTLFHRAPSSPILPILGSYLTLVIISLYKTSEMISSKPDNHVTNFFSSVVLLCTASRNERNEPACGAEILETPVTPRTRVRVSFRCYYRYPRTFSIGSS